MNNTLFQKIALSARKDTLKFINILLIALFTLLVVGFYFGRYFAKL